VVLVAWNADVLATLLPTAAEIPLFIVVAWLPNWLVLLNPMIMINNFVWIVVFLVLSLVIAPAAAIQFAGAAKLASAMASLRGRSFGMSGK
jgi:hypothetical protein